MTAGPFLSLNGQVERVTLSGHKRCIQAVPMVRSVAVSLLLLLSLMASGGSSARDVAVTVAEFPEHDRYWIVPGLDFSPDGSRLAVESSDGKINVWDWRNKRLEKTVEKAGGTNVGVANPLRYSPDGRWLAVCHTTGVGDVVVRVWDTATWSIARDLVAGPSSKGPGVCTDMGFSPDRKEFVRTADNNGQPGDGLIVYAVATWEPLWGLPLEDISPVSMAISPDGQLVAIAGTAPVFPEGVTDPIKRIQQVRYESYIYLVDLQQRRIVKRILAGVVGPLAWSPDGTRIAMTGGAGVEIFDVQSGKVARHEKVENAGRMNVRFTPDGRNLMDSDLNGMGKGLGVKIWDSSRQKLLQHIPGDIGSLAVSRDGKYLAVGMTGRTTIWEFK